MLRLGRRPLPQLDELPRYVAHLKLALDARASAVTHPLGSRGIAQQARDRLGESGYVAVGNEQASFVAGDEFRVPPDLGGDDGTRTRHRLEDAVRAVLGARGERRHVERLE